ATYTADVTTKAMSITRGSWRSGSRSLLVMGAIASQPTKDSISTVAAGPTDAGPWGANGVQLCSRRWPAPPRTATATSAMSTTTSPSCAALDARAPARVTASTASSRMAASALPAPRPKSNSFGQVIGAGLADDWGADHDAGQKRPPD